jgi:hypothetical protein
MWVRAPARGVGGGPRGEGPKQAPAVCADQPASQVTARLLPPGPSAAGLFGSADDNYGASAQDRCGPGPLAYPRREEGSGRHAHDVGFNDTSARWSPPRPWSCREGGRPSCVARDASTKARTSAATSEALTSFVRPFRLECRPAALQLEPAHAVRVLRLGVGLPTAAPVPLGLLQVRRTTSVWNRCGGVRTSRQSRHRRSAEHRLRVRFWPWLMSGGWIGSGAPCEARTRQFCGA